MKDKKGDVDIILALGGKPKKAADVDAGGDPMGSPGMGLDAAADEVLNAIQGGDSSGLKEALKAFVEQCMHGSEEYGE